MQHPIGELATKRKEIREEYLKKCQVLQVEETKLKKTTAKVGKFKKNLSVYVAWILRFWYFVIC